MTPISSRDQTDNYNAPTAATQNTTPKNKKIKATFERSVNEIPPSKRTKRDMLLKAQILPHSHIFKKFELPIAADQLETALAQKSPEIFDKLEALEDIEAVTLPLLLSEPGEVLKSLKTNNIAARALGVLKFGQQDPDWFDRMSDIGSEVGKLSEYSEANNGSLARGSYVKTSNALRDIVSSFAEDKIDSLGRLLFQADALITAKSSRPSYQALTAVALFELHDFVQKIDQFTNGKPFDNRDLITNLYKSIGIDSKTPREHLFSATECDVTKWTEATLNKALGEICSTVESEGWDKKMTASQDTSTRSYDALKSEIQTRITSAATKIM